MAGLQLSGLASGFDWKTLVDNLIELERTPITRLEAEKTLNTRKQTAFDGLKSRLTELQTANNALKTQGLFSGRTATSTNTSSNWLLSAGTGTAAGNYTFDVLQLATTSRRTGTGDIGRGLSATDDVSALTIASLPTPSAVTAGTFTVNGQTVTVALTDSLQDVFGKIATATGNAVTATYSASTDRVTLSGTSEVVMGAANDTSNFLSVMRLANNGTDTTSSGSALGSTNVNTPLINSGLRSAITAVDGTGNGAFTVNGVSIAYNINTDSLSTVMSRINSSAAGVTAAYDTLNDRMILTNKTTGDLGLNISESTGGLVDALGLGGTSVLNRGLNARYTVNGGAEVTSTSNTFDASSHGITGLTVTARSESSETIAVTSNTAAMKSAIEAFIAKFNAVQTYIDDQTKITTTNGKVSAALLSNNREIQGWAQSMRANAFSAVSGLDGTIKRLDDLGIDFSAGNSQLSIKNSTKLDAALLNNAADVERFFTQASTGFAGKFDSFITSTIGLTGTGGNLGSQSTQLTKSSSSIDEQIAALERRLVQRRAQMEAAFIAMETAQSKLQQMQTQLTNAFSTKTSNT
ncbi:MAG: flagellar filament capping protein FliD [Opitutaceae bacterium]